MKHLSIIIPAFNAEATINRCLDSVYSLPISEDAFEVIVVDDCSTDHTVDLIRAYEKKHPNLILLAQLQNHRQGAARNRGLGVAKGEYIVFLDSDDEIVSGAVSALNVSRKNSLDMAIMRFERFSSDGHLDRECFLPYKSDTVLTGVAFQTEYPFWCTGPCVY